MGDLGWIAGLGRSPGEGKSYPLQYSSLENSMDCVVHGIAKSQMKKRPGCNGLRRSLTVRSYPLLKVRGSDRERQAATAQEWRPRGASPPPRAWAAAEKSYHTPEVRDSGQEEQPHLQGAAAAPAQEGLEELPHV